ncbi:gliding motility-associated C-terminal domain-containing protein [Rhodocytophaga aerolata]|uniref:T9SS type B sorting domain-containing protein n=1 Tax=Rhodocytophaga aerolata TaxID=455078 RepID=UPI00366FC3A1
MKCIGCFICYSLFCLTCTYAQRETTKWLLGNKITVDFNQSPPQVTIDPQAPQVFSQQLASICDNEGNLLFYTDSQTVWNKQNQVMANGTNIGGERLRKVIIIPAPGKAGKYYIFTLGFINAVGDYFIDQHLVYALVDVEANNGAGAVLEKNKILYKNLHGSFTISAKCANDIYWLVGETNESVVSGIATDRIYAYRIDANGVSESPIISSPIRMSSSGGYKFSPTSDKLVFSYEGTGPSATVIADFDQLTGKVTNLRRIASCCAHVAEFSSNGTMLYLSQDSTLLQFDMRNGDQNAILNSRNVISNSGSYIGGLQLAPDGKIYISRANTKALSVIEKPEQPGEECMYTPGGLPLGTDAPYYLPSFASNLLYNSPVNRALAGEDKILCVNESIRLGNVSQANTTYRWEPANFLTDATSANPTFQYTNPTDTVVVLTYQVTVNDGICPRSDVVHVTVHPLPNPPQIIGNLVVCPGTQGVSYQVENATPESTYKWNIQRGTILAGQGTQGILVNWDSIRVDASIEVIATNAAGCTSQTLLQVRVTERLKPGIPQGATQLCLSNKDGQVYNVPYTNGSLYTWGIKGGVLLSGQGTAQVTVNWDSEGIHQLWLQEDNRTAKASCYGTSDTLTVTVEATPFSLNLNFVSIPTEKNNQVQVQGQISGFFDFTDSVRIYRRQQGAVNWMKVASIRPTDTLFTYVDEEITSENNPYAYKLAGLTMCNEPVESTIHQTIRLSATVTEAMNQIHLSWNAYEGWGNRLAVYQVWRRVDEETDYTVWATLPADVLTYTSADITDGFIHHYRIKAVEHTTGYESWSTTATLEFLHALGIPNVFTPNGDGTNDTFEIKNIHLYPENELVIYNRWGREIYRKQNYEGNWQAEGMQNGIYFYEFSTKQLATYRKGMVQILR